MAVWMGGSRIVPVVHLYRYRLELFPLTVSYTNDLRIITLYSSASLSSYCIHTVGKDTSSFITLIQDYYLQRVCTLTQCVLEQLSLGSRHTYKSFLLKNVQISTQNSLSGCL